MVPHSWIIESLKMAQCLRKSMVNWKTELTSCGETPGLVDIKRGIFQGDSLSPPYLHCLYGTLDQDLSRC